MKNEVIVQKDHRYGYDHAMYLCGAKIVEVVTLDDYKKAFNEKTVMTNFFNAAGKGEIGHEQWLEVAHQHNVPCHIDAAADMPPISNLWKYTGMGFDLVCFSGGKGIRGPQNAGLLLGKKNLTDLAHANNNPVDGVARGMKVAKEQIVGMVAAIDWLLEQSDESMEKEFTRRANVIGNIVKDVPTVKTSVFTPEVANHVPHLIVTYDPSTLGITPKEVQAHLRSLDPSIELNPSTGSPNAANGMPATPNALVVGTWMLLPGEEEIVGRQIRAALTQRKS
jgi:L-seryl-tRNA(Ser) seleniumtransferase